VSLTQPSYTHTSPVSPNTMVIFGAGGDLTRRKPERRHCSRNPKWGPSDVGCEKLGDGHGLRRPAFVLRPSRRALRAAPGLPQ